LTRQIVEPLAEREGATGIESLTATATAVSRAVQRQYEDNPYPRWLTTRQIAAKPLATVVGALFPHAAAPKRRTPTRILVAGCGTGKHAVEVATRFADCTVLAIDLSRVSLAYADRMARAQGLAHLRFAQADIMALGMLDRHFDLIESVGVLHHLADPLAGWRVLVGRLAPGGLMRIGLYSMRGRQAIHAARDIARALGGDGDAALADIRAGRAAIVALDDDHPARAVVEDLDFYTAGGCRDFLFNAEEHAFDPPAIAAMLKALDLDFLGFEFADSAPARAYAQAFPDDTAMTDLDNWDAFEEKNPSTFRNMYQFWCRKR
jgi:SAM-dependent methyltransferase